jgi:arabinogalactan oligomer/maltooligosaccharide transport system substrate-binding protein
LVQEPVKTWDELIAYAKSYNDPAKNKYACAWQAVDSYFAHGIISTCGYQLFGENHDDPTQLGWDTQEAIDGLTFYQSLNQVYPVKSTDATWDAMSSLFQKGDVPYVITGSWDIAPFVKAGIDFGVTTLPATSDGTPTKSLSTVNAIVVSSYTKYPQASMLLAKFLVEQESLKLIYDVDQQIPASTAGQQFDYKRIMNILWVFQSRWKTVNQFLTFPKCHLYGHHMQLQLYLFGMEFRHLKKL